MPEPDFATADVSGVKRKINIALLDGEGVQAGHWVLIHVGFAISRVDEAEARATLDLLEGLGQAYRDELDALREHAEAAEERSG
ncbi:MAG TPA: HypC/HybG/HupF family hydrogenase formation chaperone [Candidatus Acidoferrales bacterium]|nr:HypC/HybG/HupF family hydrogenase formation chaperone [Candidatus Acidoferrales bacterium]